MGESYDFKKIEPAISELWQGSDYTKPRGSGRPFSMYLIPPNASGPLHVGNALMIAMQDVLARYHRAQGEQTLWIPGTDHGGYETQVTFEQELQAQGRTRDEFTRRELYQEIEAFVDKNNETIRRQVAQMGASVDWSHGRFTLDPHSVAFVERMFRQMVRDNLLYRSAYMVNYCSECATVLADIELKESQVIVPLYFVRFARQGGEPVVLATTHPEFLFAVTHVLVHPGDARYAHLIGTTLINPITGKPVEVVESKRKFDPAHPEEHLAVFSPSHKKYDFEYAIRHGLNAADLLNWDGTLKAQYPGVAPKAARVQALGELKEAEALQEVLEHADSVFACKKGHAVQSVIRMTWFLRLDDKQVPLRKPTLDAIAKEKPVITPRWREKGLVDWIGKMHDWPIARQNAWGITIPIFYDVSDPAPYTVWFVDRAGERRHGVLKDFLDAGVSLDEIRSGLERIYGARGSVWALERQEGKEYLPETDTFDTWLSSGAWNVTLYDKEASPELAGFYPSSVVVIGHDLLRLSIARKMILGHYLTGRLPFRRVYFHQLLKSRDGQKMSKSLGNAITLDHFLETFGADVTRMALLSYTGSKEDFYFAPESLEVFANFAERLWVMGRAADTYNTFSLKPYRVEELTVADKKLLAGLEAVGRAAGLDIEKYYLAQAQEKLVGFLAQLEQFVADIQERDDEEHAAAVFHSAFKEYLGYLHPFMPFMTEALHTKVYNPEHLLAETIVHKK